MISIRTIGNLIKLYVRTKSLQEVVNRLYRSADRIIVEPGYVDYVVTTDGNKYRMSKLLDSVRQVQEDYHFDDIQQSDIVIDIGACIGGFSIPASRKARRVYAVEPMTPDVVKDNVTLNGRDNIDILPVALGNGQVAELKWLGETKKMTTRTLAQVKEMCGGCDFLKIDCEGCEWNIMTDELAGIRRIEMEVHRVGYPLEAMLNMLEKAGFAYEVENQPEGVTGLWLIHARKRA
jgi:FkbM family methyltransferase